MENIKNEKTTNCFVCKSIVHLMCIGISVTSEEVLWDKHIKIVCDQCLLREFSPDPKRKTTQRNSAKSLQSTVTSHSQPITNFTTPTQRITSQNNQQITEILQSIQRTVIENNKNLTEIKNNMDISGKNINEIKKTNITFADIIKSQQKEIPMNLRNQAATLSNKLATPKRTKITRESDLLSGTNASDELGNAVVIKTTTKYQQLPKAIYVSRLQTSVDVNKMSSYISKQLPDIKKEDFSLRLLVKADQKLEDLNFVSFRLSCTNELYDLLSKPDFWPKHVFIGEFITRNKSNEAANIATPTQIQSKSTVNTPSNFSNSQPKQNLPSM